MTFPIIYATGLMFPFVTRTDNPIVGKCQWDEKREHDGRCVYCYAQGPKGIAVQKNMPLYKGPPRLNEKVLRKSLKPNDFLFPSMRDWFNPNMSVELRVPAYAWIRKYAPVKALILTKNPKGLYEDLAEDLVPRNCVVGATIEADVDYPQLSGAPPQTERLEYMRMIHSDFPEYKTFVSAEPVLRFTTDFPEKIKDVGPWATAVGYDSRKCMLPEPLLPNTEWLIGELSWFTTVYVKKLRQAWWDRGQLLKALQRLSGNDR